MQLPAGFAVVIVVEGAGTLAGLDVTRGDALLVPHAAGPVGADGDLVAIACRPPGVTVVTELLLGIDVGTSACKAAVVDAHGVELAHGQAPTPWEPGPDGRRARRRDAAGRRGRAAAREALERAPEGDVAGIGVTSVAETGMLLDAAGTVLHRPVAWHDSRGAAEAQALARDLPDFTQRTGLPASALCSLAKLRHLGTEGAARWLNVAEWVVHRLGGRRVSELSLSSRTGLLDLEAVAPYADALAWAGLPADLLGELVLAGTDAGRSDGAALPGTEGAVLTVAGHDHLVAGVGVGVIAPGDVLDSCGTAEALVRVAPPPGRRRAPAQRAGRRDRRLARGRRAPGAAGRRVVRTCPARGARAARDGDRERAQCGRARHRSRRRARARARAALARALARAAARRRAGRGVARRDRNRDARGRRR